MENQPSPLTASKRFSAQPQFPPEDFPPAEDFLPPEDFSPPDDFLSPGNLNEDESGQASQIEHNYESQNTPSQPTNSSNITLNPAIFPLNPRYKKIQEPLIVKPRE